MTGLGGLGYGQGGFRLQNVKLGPRDRQRVLGATDKTAPEGRLIIVANETPAPWSVPFMTGETVRQDTRLSALSACKAGFEARLS